MKSIQEGNKHFHGPAKGCKIKPITTPPRNPIYKGHLIHLAFCEIHQKEICRCGWEWGWHYGSDSKNLEKAKERKAKQRKYSP
jgi:hypothetical protein